MQNFVTKKSLSGTLQAMKVGSVMRIKSRVFRIASVRNAAKRLRDSIGMDFRITEAGLIDECEVTRTK